MNSKFLRTALLGVCLAAVTVLSAGAAYEGVGVVTGDVVNLRAEPNTNCRVLAKTYKGQEVLVVEKVSSGWYEVDYGTIRGYLSADWVRVSEQSESSDTELGHGKVDTDGAPLNMRSGAGTSYSRVASIPSGTVLALEGMKDGWFKVSYNGKEGFVSGDYIVAAEKPAEKLPAEEVPSSDLPASELAEQIVAYAKEFLGVPYVYGANGPNSFDCSAFTKYVYKKFGYSLTRSAASQLSDGVAVDMEDIQIGDIICWRKYGSSKAATHVGIYIGNDQYIHASSSGSVCINDMSYGSSVRYVVGVRRII